MEEADFRYKVLQATGKASWKALALECHASISLRSMLMDFFLSKEYRLQQCSSNVVNHYFELYPEDLALFSHKIIHALRGGDIHAAVKRNVLRLMQFISLEQLAEDDQGFLVNKCFCFLQDSKEAIAVKAFALTIAYKASLLYPELTNELGPIAKHMCEYGSSGEKSRARKILASLQV